MRLLLTVTDVGEVPVALGAGADLIDVKDPTRGSLGWPGGEALARVADGLRGRVPLGVPLGDGPHAPGRLARRVAAAARADAAYLKVGLLERSVGGDAPAGAAGSGAGRPVPDGLDPADVLRTVRRALARAGGSATVMAVTFADAPRGAAPGPGHALGTAAAAAVDGVMLDTLGKGAGSVVDRMGVPRLRRWIRAARSEGLRTALAGGLSASDVRRLAGLDPDVVGIRGAACAGGRGGRLDPARCRALRRTVDLARAETGRAAAPPA